MGRANQQTDPMEIDKQIDKQKEADENIAAVQAYVAKEKANQFIPVESKKSNKRTHAREIKNNNISSNPYDSLDTSGDDDEEMVNCEDTPSDSNPANNLDVNMEDVEGSTEGFATKTKTTEGISENLNSAKACANTTPPNKAITNTQQHRHQHHQHQ